VVTTSERDMFWIIVCYCMMLQPDVALVPDSNIVAYPSAEACLQVMAAAEYLKPDQDLECREVRLFKAKAKR